MPENSDELLDTYDVSPEDAVDETGQKPSLKLPEQAFAQQHLRHAVVDNSDEDLSDQLSIAEWMLRWLIRLEALYLVMSCGAGVFVGPVMFAIPLPGWAFALLLTTLPGLFLALLASLGFFIADTNSSQRWYAGYLFLGCAYALLTGGGIAITLLL